MKPHIVLYLFLALCFNSNVLAKANENDTIYIKCPGQGVTTIISNCSCQTINLDCDEVSGKPDGSSISIDVTNTDTLTPTIDSALVDTSDIRIGQFSDVISLITFIVNDFNNILSEINNSFSLISIIVGVFGLLIGVLGILGFSNLKNDYRELKKGLAEQISDQNETVQEKIDEMNRLSDDIETRTNVISEIRNQQGFQNQYLMRINQYLFSITNSVVDNLGDDNERARGIRESLYRQYYIVKAFLPWSDSREDGTVAVFSYLQNNGTIDQIDDLQFIADNDPDERKRKIALETIGYIRARLMNGQAS